MTIKLSAAMQTTMWLMYMREHGRPLPLNTPLKGSYRVGAPNTLAVRGLLAKSANYAAPGYVLTATGRAWIAGQIDAAYAEALIEDAARRIAGLRCAADLDTMIGALR